MVYSSWADFLFLWVPSSIVLGTHLSATYGEIQGGASG